MSKISSKISPKVSVCIPTFNRANLLPIAIASVLEQTYSNWELIICDDGSTDGTVEHMNCYTDERIRYVRHAQNVGKSNNMRSGFEAATGEYFIKFDDDDRLAPEFLSKTSQILDQNPHVDFVGTDHWVINSNGDRNLETTQLNSQKWGRTELKEGIVQNLLEVVFIRQSFQIGATLFRRSVLQELGFMRPNIQNCEDNDLLVRLALAKKQAYYLPECLMEYRFHDGQQGIDRAIPYLKDKLNYLESFQFTSETLENVRRSRMIETQLLLGLRLIEKGDTQKGRELVLAGKSNSSLKAYSGFVLSFFPPIARKPAFELLRGVRSS